MPTITITLTLDELELQTLHEALIDNYNNTLDFHIAKSLIEKLIEAQAKSQDPTPTE